MKTLEKNLSEIFDIEPTKKLVEEMPVVVSTNNDVETDFNIARTNINSLLQKGNVAVDNLLNVAKETEHPRAYEVVANLIKTMADLNKDLLDIQKKRKELNNNKPTSEKTVIDKAVFIGSTTEMVKLIRSSK
jgi:uncharacterized protein involved in exopolysaccharide biosynthesis